MIAALLLLLATVNPPLAPRAETTVRDFYRHVVEYKPLGIPQGKARAAMWPLMTPRLSKVLESAELCEMDYAAQHRDTDEKPEYWWLEHGLFSGGNERALPVEAAIVDTKQTGEWTADVRVRLTYRDGDHAESWEAIASIACDEKTCLIDDFTEFDETGKLRDPLTRSFTGCDGDRWVGEKAP